MEEDQYINATDLGKITSLLSVLNTLKPDGISNVIIEEEFNDIKKTVLTWQKRAHSLLTNDPLGKELFEPIKKKNEKEFFLANPIPYGNFGNYLPGKTRLINSFFKKNNINIIAIPANPLNHMIYNPTRKIELPPQNVKPGQVVTVLYKRKLHKVKSLIATSSNGTIEVIINGKKLLCTPAGPERWKAQN